MNQEGGGGHTRERWVVRCLCLKGLEREREREGNRERERERERERDGECFKRGRQTKIDGLNVEGKERKHEM